MKFIDTARRAGRSIRQAKARTILTSLAIGVGAFTITLALAAGAGGRQYAESIVKSNTNAQQLQVTQKQDSTRDSSKPQEYSTDPTVMYGGGFSFKQLKQSDIDKIAKVEGVSSVTPAYDTGIEYVTRAGQKKYQGTLDTYDPNVQLSFVSGDGQVDGDGIVIPDSYVDVLGFSSAATALHQTLEVAVTQHASTTQPPAQKMYTFHIVGVTKKNPLAVMNSSSLYISEANAKMLYDYINVGTPGYGVFSVATVQAKSGVSTEDVKARLEKLGYEVQTAQDLLSTIFQFINVLQGILLGFGGLAILTSVFGIINTQYISVLERTQQIGLMKALGMRRRDVGRLFKLEAAWIGFLGGAIGAGLAIISGTIANPFITKALSLGEGTNLLIFEPVSVATIIVGLMLVSVGAGILPARKAAKLDPIEALRTE